MATKIKITNMEEGFQSLISNGRHAIIGDEPVISKGTDLGFSPTELLLSSLAFCKVATVRYIARKKQWEIGEVDAELAMEVKRDGKQLFPRIKVEITIEGDLTEEQKQELLGEADRCYIHRLIEGDWEIEETASKLQMVS
ncbi:putative redox protein [Catalinimonas alkaloidigena]|uniref:OsmC family protein n=1 Tax=Catalinimonas alkaloidigena TaxID=1075417 RepID=UPI0024073142|nr:OsmC family protein [Catalinimonas alkaloidigena]MDF9795080.1 putative redox protein [Catalinimonas alkaloidigena]